MALNSDLVGDPCLRKLLHRVDTRRVVHDRNDGWNLVVQMISFVRAKFKMFAERGEPGAPPALTWISNTHLWH